MSQEMVFLNSSRINFASVERLTIKKFFLDFSQKDYSEGLNLIKTISDRFKIDIIINNQTHIHTLYYFENLEDEIRKILGNSLRKEKDPYDYEENKINFITNCLKYSLRNSNFYIIPSRRSPTAISTQELEKVVDIEVYQHKPIIFQKIVLYPGFTFKVYQGRDGEPYVFVDTRHKFFSKFTLRDEINEYGLEDLETLERNLKNEYLFQTCSKYECLFLKNGECTLSPINFKRSGYKFEKFIMEKPKDATFTDRKGIIHNYYDYSFKDCLFFNKLKAEDQEPKIKNETPLIETKRGGGTYTFVPERLRRQIKIDRKIIREYEDRKKITNILHATPKKRYKDSIENLKNLVASPSGMRFFTEKTFLKKPLIKIKQPKYTIKIDNKLSEVLDPFKFILKNRFTISDFDNQLSNINLGIIKSRRHLSKNPARYVNSIKNRLIQNFNVKTDYYYFDKLKDIRELETNIVLAIMDDEDDYKWLREIKRECHKLNINVQGLNVNQDIPFSNHINETSLGIYSKAGGIAWVLNKDLNSWFLGLQSNFWNGTYSMILISPKGSFRGSFTGKFNPEDKSDYITKLKINYNSNIRPIIRNEKIILHKRGILYPFEHEFCNSFNDVFVITRSYYERIYSQKENKKPDDGTYLFLESGKKAILVTTSEMIEDRMPEPIKITKVNANLEHEDIETTFLLSRMHLGYTKSKSKFPCTLKYAEKCLVLSNLESAPLEKWVEKPWFL